MFQSKINILILSVCVILSACKDSPVDTEPPEEEPLPSLAISNPGANSTLSGTVTITATAENVEGVSFYLEETLLAEVSGSPFEVEVNTRDFNNGSYVIRAEAKAADSDSTLTDEVAVNFENYGIRLNANGWVNAFKTVTGRFFLMVAAPNGKILQKVDLQEQQDENITLLPPGLMPEANVNSVSITVVQYFPSNGSLHMGTFGGLEINSELNWIELGGSGPSPSDSTLLRIELGNLPTGHDNYAIKGSFVNYSAPKTKPDSLKGNFKVTTAGSNLIINSTAFPALYYWEKDLQNIDTLSLDVTEDFTAMAAHNVSVPSNTQITSATYSVAVDESYGPEAIGPYPYFTEEGNDDIALYTPETDNPFSTFLQGFTDQGWFAYQGRIGNLPSAFDVIDLDLEYLNRSLDQLTIQRTGDERVDAVVHFRLGSGTTWFTVLPDTTEHWIYPRIADSLDASITANFDRQTFSANSTIFISLQKSNNLDGYKGFVAENMKPSYNFLNVFPGISKFKILSPTGTGGDQIYFKQRHRKALKESGDVKRITIYDLLGDKFSIPFK